MQQHASNKSVRAAVLSRDTLEATQPLRSVARSKTVLELPVKAVGTLRSIKEGKLSKKEFQAGLRLGAYKQHA